MILFGVMLTLIGILGLVWGFWYYENEINPFLEIGIIGLVLLIIGIVLLVSSLVLEKKLFDTKDV